MRKGCATYVILLLFAFWFWYQFIDEPKKEIEPDYSKWPPNALYELEHEGENPSIQGESYNPDSLPLRVNKEQQLIINGERYRVRKLPGNTHELIKIR